MLHFTKKRALMAGAVATLAMGGLAFAFFTSTGSGTGSASVGSSTGYTVTVSSDASGTLYPGFGTETLTYDIQNTNPGHQAVQTITSAIADDGAGNIVTGATNTPVPGCLASWFHTVRHLGSGVVLPHDLAHNAHSTGTVDVTMDDANTPQDLCQGKSPNVTVSAT